MTSALTLRERELARHALGLPNIDWHQRRNIAYCNVYSDDGIAWRLLCARGMAEQDISAGDTTFFRLTRAGALAALEPGETLDEEDFTE